MLRMAQMRSKAAWTSTNVFHILRNETYVGDKLLQKTPPWDLLTKKPDPTLEYDSYYLEDDHEAIIDRETWDRTQAIIEQRRSDKENGIYGHGMPHHVFYGKVFCGECGEAYKRRTFSVKESGGKRYYNAWNCRERQKGKNGNGCKNITLQEKVLEELITAEMGWDDFSDERFNSEVERVEVTGDGVRVIRKDV